MEILNQIINLFYPVSGSVLILPLIITIINNYDTLPVERKLMTNIKKLKFHFSLISIGASVISLILFFLMFNSIDLENNFKLYIAFIVFLFVLSWLAMTIGYFLVTGLSFLLGHKFYYYIELVPEEKWYLSKKTNEENLILFSKVKNCYKTIKEDSLLEKEIYYELKKITTKRKDIYKWINDKNGVINGILTILAFLSIIFAAIYNDQLKVAIPMALVYLLSMVGLISVLIISKIIKLSEQ